MTWYLLTPADYAKGLRYSAGRSEDAAAYQQTQNKPWSSYETDRYRRQARRLRAMALLCDRSDAPRAGGIDFHGLNDPRQTREEEDRIVQLVEEGRL